MSEKKLSMPKGMKTMAMETSEPIGGFLDYPKDLETGVDCLVYFWCAPFVHCANGDILCGITSCCFRLCGCWPCGCLLIDNERHPINRNKSASVEPLGVEMMER